MERIRFERSVETAAFFSPLAGTAYNGMSSSA